MPQEESSNNPTLVPPYSVPGLERLPLVPQLGPAAPYPVEHLGTLLAGAAEAIAQKIRVPVAIAAHSVLSTAALIAQSYADVLLPYGQTRPLSLFFVTIAGSGDRKTSADNEAIKVLNTYENSQSDKYQDKLFQWSISKSLWSAETGKIKSDRQLDSLSRRQQLMELGPEPSPPSQPALTSNELTFEGLVKNWSTLPPSLGIYSAEGAQFTAGHGMSGEGRLRTAGGLSELWDGKTFKRIRAHDGIKILRGRRLSVHLMVQPEAATKFVSDPVLRDQGLLSRMLVAFPTSIIGTRKYRQASAEIEECLNQYHDRIKKFLLESPMHSADTHRGLSPRTIGMDDAARSAWIQYHDWVESSSGPGGELNRIVDIAAKSAEQAARIAGVLTLVEDNTAELITEQAMTSGIWLAIWYFNEALRLRDAHPVNEKLIKANALLEWLNERKEEEIRFSSILQFGPGSTRTKQEAEAALNLLMEHQLINEVRKRPRAYVVTRELATP